MHELNIDTLIRIIRGLNNQITVAKLSSDMAVSPSTISRCKTGRWPHSITITAISKVFRLYKLEFFADDENKICTEILHILNAMNIPTENYEYTIKKEGFEAFISCLINDAYAYEKILEKSTNKKFKKSSSEAEIEAYEKTQGNTTTDVTLPETIDVEKTVKEKNTIAPFLTYLNNNWFCLFLWLIAFLIFAIIMNIMDTD